jgi:hydrogenase expression/formation protein HypD
VKYLDEYRDASVVHSLADRLAGLVTRPWVLMEICGGQTHTIMKYGLDELLPPGVELVHGPGCPVCVTPLEMIDKAIALSSRDDVIFVSFGDMLRVPGSTTDLLRVKAAGGDVRIVYSPLEAVALAQRHPDKQVVFFAIGFETTAPANAAAVARAHALGLDNFSLLVSHVLVPPALRLLLGSEGCRVQGLVAPGHVCTVVGTGDYEALSREHRVPIVVGGFEPVDLLEAVVLLVAQLEAGRAEVENQYARSVRREGNAAAQQLVDEVFEVRDQTWRGIGPIPRSGLGLRAAYARYDAVRLFDLADTGAAEPEACRSAEVLLGTLKPSACEAFGEMCTPERPLGAPMVSAEGACAAYFSYGRHRPRPVAEGP